MNSLLEAERRNEDDYVLIGPVLSFEAERRGKGIWRYRISTWYKF